MVAKNHQELLCGKRQEDSFSEASCGVCGCQHLRFLIQSLELPENIALSHPVCRCLLRQHWEEATPIQSAVPSLALGFVVMTVSHCLWLWVTSMPGSHQCTMPAQALACWKGNILGRGCVQQGLRVPSSFMEQLLLSSPEGRGSGSKGRLN